MAGFRTIEWVEPGLVRMLDQRRLPHQVEYCEYQSAAQVAEAIHEMVIRGAPAIGAAAAYGLALCAYHSSAREVAALKDELQEAAAVLLQARPTAVNLSWALERMMRRLAASGAATTADISAALLAEAHAIFEEDIAINRQIGLNALPLVPDGAAIIHHCNTGSLATVDYGTALGVIRCAHEAGKKVSVLVDETRPRLQGARLTAWELLQYGVPFKVIVDGASGSFLRRRLVDLCVVGVDRMAANGDTVNKIGTYNLAVVAHANGVPFYVAAPTSSIDLSMPDGDQIEIEERSPLEVTHVGAEAVVPQGTPVGNPAFDVTPARYITAIITELGVVYPPFSETIAALFKPR